MTTITELQNAVDKLLLETFEVVRGHSDTSETPLIKAKKLQVAYEEALKSVDELLGINKSKEEQEAYLQHAAKEYEALKQEVVALESKLRGVAGQVDVELEGLLGDAAIGLKH
jgi:hypothetical protein